jgi:thiamine biosynthesis lipoprotein
MGTVVTVTSISAQAADIVFKEFKTWEERLSHFKPTSIVETLNNNGAAIFDPQILEIINKSLEVSRVSAGAFDISCAPLVDIWKKAIQSKTAPDKQEIRKALSLVGWKDVSVNTKTGEVKFKRKGMSIDLGGIAEGFTVDKAVKKLRQAGINSALINAGGDIYCLGSNAGQPWRVGVAHPRKTDSVMQVYNLVDKAITTSGDYEQYFSVDKKRFSHIIDPRTGYPVDNGICSVTVVAPDCTTADALATTIFVLGEEEGMKLAEKFKVDEVKIIKTNELF